MGPQISKSPETCSNNGCVNLVDKPAGKYPRWCGDCMTRYQKEHKILQLERKERRGFIQGARAMREILVDEFMKLPSSTFRGDEIAGLIAQAPGPLLGLDEAEEATPGS